VPEKRSIFHQNLMQWYGTHGRRDLPWRNTRDAYAIYLSEVMLQQTQVATVLARFYQPFLARFPTLKALANANEREVLEAWQGLGYYSRARNLHKAAKACAGKLPSTVDELVALPGIGRNTAHAVASFAFGLPVPVMEANVKRVLCRIFALEQPTDNQLWEGAHALLDSDHVFDYNQAMMDIGAMVCRKRAPLCAECPASGICKGKANPEAYPQKKAKKAPPVRRKDIVVVQHPSGSFYATPRASRFLGGLYHFCELEPGENGFALGAQRLERADAVLLGGVTQQYSHFTLDAQIWLLRLKKTPKTAQKDSWHSWDMLVQLPMSMAEKKILALIEVSNPSKYRQNVA
jgi:A/G-specific adenine glycosylase